MLLILLTLVLTELLSLAALRHHLLAFHKITYYLLLVIHSLFSIWLWVEFIELSLYKGLYDEPGHAWLLTSFAGMFCAIIIPRIILIIFHYTGKLVGRKKGSHSRWLTNSGLVTGAFIFTAVTFGNLYGRFNFTEEKITIGIKDLKSDLDGFKIVHVSDYHILSYYHHKGKLISAREIINGNNPDLILNTGDFTTFGWREFGRNDTIFAKEKSRYGKFAIMGNHDAGTYNPDLNEDGRKDNRLKISELLKSSGYTVLNDTNVIIRIGNSKLAIAGVTTGGRRRNISHGNLDKALSGIDSSDLTILLTHDPNHWVTDIAGKKTDINLTFSGHTHGMQIGILTKKFRWSPAQYFYPNWNGLYTVGDQKQYVNRGLGILSVPFRIGMPPEITVITLRKE